MKTFTTLPIIFFLTLVSWASAASSFENATKCGARFPRINIAIEAFCRHSKTDVNNSMMIPSEYARQGIGSTGKRGNRFIVRVEGNCNPPQWLPYKWCVAQFQEMCANAKNPWGYHTQNFGNNGCQKFIIGPRQSSGYLTKPNVPF